MKKINFIIIIMLFLLSLNSPVYSKTSKKPSYLYIKPLSFNFSINTGSLFFIYIPQANYYFDITGSFGLSFAAEYKFTPYFALENGLSFYGSCQYTNTQYIYEENNDLHNIELIDVNLYYQYLLSLKFYFPEKPIKKKIKMMIRFGLGCEVWLLSYYLFYNDKKLISNGFLFNSQKHGPNVYDEYINYKDIHNVINLGVHAGFGPKILLKKEISFIPELRYTFFAIPVRDGTKVNPNINGVNTFFVRSDGTDEKALFDFKMMVELSFTFQFYKGLETDSLSALIKRQKEEKKRKLEEQRKKKQEEQKKKNIKK